VHIAFFNRSYYPDQTATGQLLTELCEDLVRVHGCQVSVVTAKNTAKSTSEVFSRIPPRYSSRHGVRIYRVWGTRFDKRRFAGRAANYLSYFFSACWTGLRLERPDVVVALTDPPIIGLAAWLSGRRFGAPLVMAFKDLFPEVAALLPDFHSDTVNAALQRVNRFLTRRAAMNIALGETMRQRLIEDKGAAPERTVIVADWADTSAMTPGPRENVFSAAHGLTGKFVVMHSGNLGLAQSLETIVEAAARLREEPGIQFVFQGDGVKKPDLERQVRTLGLTNVLFLPFQPKERLAESFASADLFVVSLQAGLAGYIVPSKLYGILAAGRPYVAAVEPACEVATLTVRHDCGAIAAPGDSDSLARAILGFYRDPARTARSGRNARALSASFDRRRQVEAYLRVLEAVRRPAERAAPVAAAG
jgi:glycosyltransferase involved in cell wall biosynthesis